MSLTRLRINDLPVDVPLPWPVFGKTGMALLPKGGVVAGQIADALVQSGLYRRRYDDADETLPAVDDGLIVPGLSLPVENIMLGLIEGGHAERINVSAEFFGLIPGVSLIVRHPLLSGRLLGVSVGQRLVVSVLVRKHAHAFSSQILCMSKLPTPYLHVSYPEAIESAKLRNASRVNVALLAVVTAESGGTMPARITNLSSQGLGLLCECPLGEPGQGIELSFTLPVAERSIPIDTTGAIRNVSALKRQKCYRYGIELDRLTAEQQLAVEAFIYDNM